MQIFHRPRMAGKTTDALLWLAARKEHRILIVCDYQRASFLRWLHLPMKDRILTPEEFWSREDWSTKRHELEIGIDDADEFLCQTFRASVTLITMTDDDYEKWQIPETSPSPTLEGAETPDQPDHGNGSATAGPGQIGSTAGPTSHRRQDQS